MPTPQEALDFAKRFIGRMPLDDAEMKYRILQDANDIIWQRAPWRWSVGMLEVVTLVNSQQDYTLVTPVSDCNQLIQAQLIEEDGKHDLVPMGNIPATATLKGTPTAINFNNTNTLRVLPVPYGYTTLPKILSWYKKNPPTISGSNIGTAWETITGASAGWFHVYQHYVLYYALAFANSPRAGGATTVEGRVQYSGQLGIAEAALASMVASEPKLFDTMGREVKA